MEMEKVIIRHEMSDEQYITEIENLLEDMSDQAEIMCDAMALVMAGLQSVVSTYQDSQGEIKDIAFDMYRLADLALTMVKGDPEPDEGIH